MKCQPVYKGTKYESLDALKKHLDSVAQSAATNYDPNEIPSNYPVVEAAPELTTEEKAVLTKVMDEAARLGDRKTFEKIEALLNPTQTFDDPKVATLSDRSVSKLRSESTKVKGLTLSQEHTLTSYIVSTVYRSTFGNKSISEDALKSKFDSLINNRMGIYKNRINDLGPLVAKLPGLIDVIAEASGSVDVLATAKDNYKVFYKEAAGLIKKDQNIDLIKELDDVDGQSEREKIHAKSSYSDNLKAEGSPLIRQLYRTILNKNPNGTDKLGAFGIPEMVGIDKIEEATKNLLANVDPNWAAQREVLEENADRLPWLQNLIDILDDAGTDDQIRKSFTNHVANHSMSMTFVNVETKKGPISVKLFNTDSKSPEILRMRDWRSTLLTRNGLVKFDSKSSSHYIDVAYARDVLAQFETIKSKGAQVSALEVQSFLKEFGVYLDVKTIGDILVNGLEVLNVQGRKQTMSAGTLFAGKLNSSSPVAIFGAMVQSYVDSGEKSIPMTLNSTVDPLAKASSMLKKMAALDVLYSDATYGISLKDGDKTLNSKPKSTYATDRANELKKETSIVRERKSTDPFSTDSGTLALLNESNKVRDLYGIEDVALSSLKVQGQKSFGDTNMTSLTPEDGKIVRVGVMTARGQEKFEGTYPNSDYGSLRVGRVVFGTMSDKKKVYLEKTILLDITSKDLEGTAVTDEIASIFFDQTVKPELNRILDYLSKGGHEVNNIKDYNHGATLFLNMPFINNVKMPKGETIASLFNGPNAVEFVNNILSNPGMLDTFTAALRDAAKQDVKNFIENQAKAELMSWDNVLYKTNGDQYVSSFIDAEFLESKLGENEAENLYLTAVDYVVNNAIALSNMDMMYNGDPAFYSKGGMRKFFHDGNYAAPKSETSYVEAVQKVHDVNKGKRLALLSAPRDKGSMQIDDQYIQLHIEDHISYTDNLDHLMKIHYGKKAGKEAHTAISAVLDGIATDAQDAFVKNFKNSYPIVAPFLEIESTDAQEYTTALEHLNFVYNRGQVKEATYNDLKEKIEAQEKFLEKNPDQSLPAALFLSDNDLKTIMGPVKPVATGEVWDPVTNRYRMTYVKSSAFPLLPQVTQGKVLERLRKLITKVQKDTGKPVRASFQTANKVGASKNPLRLYNQDQSYNEPGAADIKDASVVMDRFNMGQQQNVPNKAKKKKEEITIGSQLIRMLFGNGVINIENVDFNSMAFTKSDMEGLGLDPTKAKDIKQIMVRTFNELIDLKAKELKKSMSLDSNYEAVNNLQTMLAIKDVFLEEAKGRKYGANAIAGLEIKTKVRVFVDGKKKSGFLRMTGEDALWLNKKLGSKEAWNVDEKTRIATLIKSPNADLSKVTIKTETSGFTLPVWFHADSNKYQAILNSIISNTLTKHKLPGSSYVAATEAGWGNDTQIEDLSTEVKNSIVHLGDYDGGKLKPAVFHEDGSLKHAQILVRSTIRDNDGNLIQFVFSDGTHNPDYIQVVNGKYQLIPGRVDPRLFLGTSFRIPTSSHVSASTIEIAGILPQIAGDIMVVPKNFTTQKGLDFDVDKENVYSFHTYTDESGKVSVIDRALVSTLPMNEQKQYRRQMLENELSNIHFAVLGNKDVQTKIQSALSIDFAKGQASVFDALTSSKTTNKYYSPLTAANQEAKMATASVGKTAIGFYANFSSLLGMVQSMPTESKLSLYFGPNDSNIEFNGQPLNTIIGSNSDGKVMAQPTVPAEVIAKYRRSLAQAAEERVNIATDDAKEQVLGRVGLNATSIKADIGALALGLDLAIFEVDKADAEANPAGVELVNGKYYRAVSVSMMLTSHPLIKQYTLIKEKSKGLSSDYSEIQNEIKALFENYGIGKELEMDLRGLSPKTIYNSLKNADVRDSSTNGSIIALYSYLESVGGKTASLASEHNLISKGLGISIFNGLSHQAKIAALSSPRESGFQNSDKLYFNITEKRQPGAVRFVDPVTSKVLYRVPTGPSGAVLLHAAKAADKVIREVYPLKSGSMFTGMFGFTESSVDPKNLLQFSSAKTRDKILFDFKSAVQSSTYLGLWENTFEERDRLLTEDAENGKFSIGLYLKELSINSQFQSIMKNKLLSAFTYQDLNSEGFSLPTYNNNKEDDLDEVQLENALLELILEDEQLPTFNGKPYSTRQLAIDLIKASYLKGNKGFNSWERFIPLAVLEELGVSKKIRKIEDVLKGSIRDSNPEQFKQFISFSKQFFQHNPELSHKHVNAWDPVTKTRDYNSFINISKANFRNGTDLNQIELSFSDKSFAKKFFNKALGEYELPPMFHIQNNEATDVEDRVLLYEQTEVPHVYRRVNLLGDSQSNEYDLGKENVSSLIHKNVHNDGPVKIKERQKGFVTYAYGIRTSGNMAEIFENLNKNFEGDSNLKSWVKYLVDNKIVPNDVTLKITDLGNANGRYDATNKVLLLDNTFLQGAEEADVVKVFIKEISHAVTVHEMQNHFDRDGNLLSTDAPSHILQMKEVFDAYREHVQWGPEKAAIFQQARKDGTLTQEMKDELYPASDIFEFVENFMTETGLQETLSGLDAGGETLLQKFINALMNMFESIAPNSPAATLFNSIIQVSKANDSQRKEIAGTVIANVSDITEHLSPEEIQQFAEQPDFGFNFDEAYQQAASGYDEIDWNSMQEPPDFFNDPKVSPAQYELVAASTALTDIRNRNVKGLSQIAEKLLNRNHLDEKFIELTNVGEVGLTLTQFYQDNTIENTLVSANRVVVNPSEITDEIIVHEELHRYTNVVLYNGLYNKAAPADQVKFAKDINKLWLALEAKGVEGRMMQNPKELVAYGLTNPESMKALKEITIDNKSTLDMFTDALMNLLFGKSSKSTNAYKALKKSFDMLMESPVEFDNIYLNDLSLVYNNALESTANDYFNKLDCKI